MYFNLFVFDRYYTKVFKLKIRKYKIARTNWKAKNIKKENKKVILIKMIKKANEVYM